MAAEGDARLERLLKTASLAGKEVGLATAQAMILPHVRNVFTEHDHEELETFILSNYPLARKHTPPGVKASLKRLGANQELRRQWEGFLVNYLTPEQVLEWLRTPEDWLDGPEAAGHREELRRCAATIEHTPGGRQWLNEQIATLYRYANITPTYTTGQEGNE